MPVFLHSESIAKDLNKHIVKRISKGYTDLKLPVPASLRATPAKTLLVNSFEPHLKAIKVIVDRKAFLAFRNGAATPPSTLMAAFKRGAESSESTGTARKTARTTGQPAEEVDSDEEDYDSDCEIVEGAGA